MASNVEQDLNRLIQGDLQIVALRAFSPFGRPYIRRLTHVAAEFDLKVAMSALAGLVSYLSLLSDDSNFGAYKLKQHDLSQYMRLDASAIKALNLMPDPSGLGGSSKTMSIFGLLNRCKTAQGTRLLAQWLKQPLINLDAIGKLELFLILEAA